MIFQRMVLGDGPTITRRRSPCIVWKVLQHIRLRGKLLRPVQGQGRVVKAGSMEIVLYNHVQGRFHVKSRRGRSHRLNLHDKNCTCGKTLIYGFPCSHIIAACQHRCIDFRFFVQGSRTTIHRQACFIQYSMKMSDLFMMVLRLYHLSQ